MLLDPLGWAIFEGDLLDALDGPRGLTWLGTTCGLVDVELRSAAWLYEAADQISTQVAGRDPGRARAAGRPRRRRRPRLARTGSPLVALQKVVTDDPQLADTVADELGVPLLLEAGAGALPDGHGVAVPLGVDATRRGERAAAPAQ